VTEPGLIVVGSGHAGVAAAESFRAANDDLPVRVLTCDDDLPYARPPLSKEYLRGETTHVALHPAQWFDERGIDVVCAARVDGVDVRGHTISVGGTQHRYHALVLACGATPVPLPVPGGANALQLRSLGDAARLRDASESAASAVVIGAGFIGCEAAASLAMQGIAVSLVAPESAPQIERLGAQAGARLLALLDRAGVRYVGGVGVASVEPGAVRLEDGATIDAEVILAATGVRPESGLAGRSGITLQDKRILVGSDMRTSAEDVYAAGDVALAFNTSAGRPLAVEHWQDAIDHGQIAGAAAAGESRQWDGVPGFWTTIGDTTLKYHAWGDGYEDCQLVEHGGGFTIWYETDGAVVGVLTCDADEDYDLGETLIRRHRPAPVSMR
jgi:3-phenylpropionate/trans-cinnamate dioxygenase ferredoxin reductase component